MGISLHIQRVDGHEGDLPIADLTSSLQMFEAIPWQEEISKWEKVPDEEKEVCRPLFQLFDDSGHTLHITAYSQKLMGVAFNYPTPPSPCGMNYEVEDGYIGTDQYPRSELKTLFDCFFTSDTQAMLALLGRYPMSSDTEKP